MGKRTKNYESLLKISFCHSGGGYLLPEYSTPIGRVGGGRGARLHVGGRGRLLLRLEGDGIFRKREGDV